MKKVVSLALAAVMAASMLAGCGGEKPAANSSATEKASAQAGGVIKVGNSGPLTNDYAMYGKAVEYGLKLGFEEINAKGGLQYEVRVEDDEGDSEMAVNSFNTLMDWGMQIMAGPTTSGCAVTIGSNCAEDHVFMLTPSGSDPNIIATGDNVFQVAFTDPNQGLVTADYISMNYKDSKIGLIYESSNPYSVGVRDTFVSEAKTKGLNVVCEESYTSDNKADLSTQVTKCQAAGCDLVFMPIYSVEGAQILTYANKIGYEPLFVGCDGLDGILAVEGFDPKLAEGVLLLTPFDATADDERVQEFVKNYTEKFGVVPNQFAADAYDAAYIIDQACQAAGVTADMDYQQVCDKVVEQMLTMTYSGITGETMTWQADGAVSKLPKAVKVENGVYVTAD